MPLVVDNLLPNIYLNKLDYLLNGHPTDVDDKSKLNWFWNGFTASDSNKIPMDDNFMFTHVLWNKRTDNRSPFFEVFCPIVYFIDKINPVKDVIRMKLNLYTNQGKRIDHAKHYDLTDVRKDPKGPLDNCMITVLNFTTCNGGTNINDKDYLSNYNQAVMFDNHTTHSGFTQTDKQRRVVLNIATTHEKMKIKL
jgi:hypothetical protein